MAMKLKEVQMEYTSYNFSDEDFHELQKNLQLRAKKRIQGLFPFEVFLLILFSKKGWKEICSWERKILF